MDKTERKTFPPVYGRYGIDQLGNFMMWAAVAMMIFGAVVRSSLIYTLAFVLIVWADVRIMSKNHSKRYAENQKFLELKNRVVGSSEAEPVHSRIKSIATSAARPAISRCVCRKEKATSRSAARNAEQIHQKHLIKRSSAIHVWLCDHPKG